jgi:DDE_Tnp_1-associated
MSDLERVSLHEVVVHFQELEDPRSTINQRHPLTSVLVIAMLAVLAGAGGPTAIARWAAFKEEIRSQVLDLPNGVPRKDVFRRVLMALKPAAFQAYFASWLRSLRIEAAAETGVEQPILAVDGKILRRSHDHDKGLGALHSVSVWASEYGLSLGQTACAEKSNEITAIPELLRLVDIKGAIKHQSEKVLSKDFKDKQLGKVAPYSYSANSTHLDPPALAKVCSPPGLTEDRAWTSSRCGNSSPS